MRELDISEQLNENLLLLQDLYRKLEPDAETLNRAICEQRMLPDGLIPSLRGQLDALSETLTAIRRDYGALSLGQLPKRIEEVSGRVQSYHDTLSRKECYFEALCFVRGLYSDDVDVQESVEDEQEKLREYDCLTMSVKAVERKLGKYVRLKEAFEEPDSLEKISHLMKLKGQFGDTFLYELIKGSILAGEPEEEPEEETDGQPEEEQTAVPEAVSEIVPAQHDEAAEAVPEEPAGEEAAPEELQPEHDGEPLEGMDWSGLPVKKPGALCVHIEEDSVSRERVEGTKKFSLKTFKKECKKLPDGVLPLLWILYNDDFIMPETAGAYYGDKSEKDAAGHQEETEVLCHALLELGYMNRYTVKNYGSIYGLSGKGARILESRDLFGNMGKWINPLRLNKLKVNPEPDSVLAGILQCRSMGIPCKLKEGPDVHSGRSSILWKSAFCLCSREVSDRDDAAAMIAGIISRDPADYRMMLDEIRKAADQHRYLFLVGTGLRQAKALAKLVDADLSAPDSGVEHKPEILYCSVDREEYYYLDNGKMVTPAQWRQEHCRLDEPETGAADEAGTDPLQAPPSYEAEQEGPGQDRDSEEVPSGTVIERTEEPTAEEVVAEAEQKLLLPTASDFTPETEAETERVCTDLLIREKFCCAAAYGNALAQKFPSKKTGCLQLSLALNDPAVDCGYSVDRLSEVFFSPDSVSADYCLMAAALRCYFADGAGYDYSLRQMYDILHTNRLTEHYEALGQLLYELYQFQLTYGHGVDFYADYRQKQGHETEKNIKALKLEARTQREAVENGIRRDKAFPIFPEMKKLLLGPGSDLDSCLDDVLEDRRDDRDFLRDFLQEYYIKDEAEISRENIDAQKIEAAIDDIWDKAAAQMKKGIRKSASLVGSLRTSLHRAVRRSVEILCDYVTELGSGSMTQDDPGQKAYREIRKKLLGFVRDVLSCCEAGPEETPRDRAGQAVLRSVLRELRQKLDGTWQNSAHIYFYLDFLKQDRVLLDDGYLPVLDEVRELPEVSVFARIRAHGLGKDNTLEKRFDEIFNGGDDYGSAELIFRYLQREGKTELLGESEDYWEDRLRQARKMMEDRSGAARRDKFVADMELAQSYGQVENDRKDTFLEVMDLSYEQARESGNYGFFYQILEAIRNQIRQEAALRTEGLRKQLVIYQEDHPDWERDEAVRAAVEKVEASAGKQNYAAAEDFLNRLITGDLDSGSSLPEEDWLEEFMDDYHNCVMQAGSARETLQSKVIIRAHNKESKGASRLIQSWPKGNEDKSVTRIEELMRALGFSVERVESQPKLGQMNHYTVRLKHPVNGRKNNYTHPISAFGSQAEDKAFRVVTIFGKMSARSLVDTFQRIGSAKDTIVLLDYALSLEDKRELARLSKTEHSDATFLVIDRTVMVYLANHYSETAVNRMLMAITVPFAFYQPYVAEASKEMPPEMFMGRKYELQKIESASGVNIVYGGRQLGKSKLLKMARQDIDRNENGDRAVLVEIKGLNVEQTARKVSQELADEDILTQEQVTGDWNELAQSIRARLKSVEKKPIPYLLLLMDEADAFLEHCGAVNYQPFDALKEIQSIGMGRFKFVVAGLRNVVRFNRERALGNNSVLTQLSSLTITPFKATEGRELLEVPLFYLGFRFRRDTRTDMLVSTILGTTNYFPGLIQLYCQKLVEGMQKDYAGYRAASTPPYIMEEEHVKRVLSDRELNAEIQEKFNITLQSADQDDLPPEERDDYYYIIALLAAYHIRLYPERSGFSPEELRELAVLEDVGKIGQLTEEKLKALMEEMQELNVLQQAGGSRYRFARRNFIQMMGSEEEIGRKLKLYQNAGAEEE